MALARMKLVEAAARARAIRRAPIRGFPCRTCRGSGEFQDSTEGGIWTLCDCPGNIAMFGTIDAPRPRPTYVVRTY